MSSRLSVVVSSRLSGLSARRCPRDCRQGCFLSYLFGRPFSGGLLRGSGGLLLAALAWRRRRGSSGCSGRAGRPAAGRAARSPAGTGHLQVVRHLRGSRPQQGLHGPAPPARRRCSGAGGLPRRRRRGSFIQIDRSAARGNHHIGASQLAGQQQLGWPGIGFLLPQGAEGLRWSCPWVDGRRW